MRKAKPNLQMTQEIMYKNMLNEFLSELQTCTCPDQQAELRLHIRLLRGKINKNVNVS